MYSCRQINLDIYQTYIKLFDVKLTDNSYKMYNVQWWPRQSGCYIIIFRSHSTTTLENLIFFIENLITQDMYPIRNNNFLESSKNILIKSKIFMIYTF